MAFDKTKNKSTGRMGEDEAETYLLGAGYKILDRNIAFPFGEIDILAEDKKNNSIILVEVKSVRGTGFGTAQELVRYKKQNKLKLLARALEQKYPGRTIRIDVIGVEFDRQGNASIDHLQNAVY